MPIRKPAIWVLATVLIGVAGAATVPLMGAMDPSPVFECRLSGGRTLYRGDTLSIAAQRCANYAFYGTWFQKPDQIPTLRELDNDGNTVRKIVFNNLCDYFESPENIAWQEKPIATVGADVNALKIPMEYVKDGACFAITAFDTSGNESEKSKAVCLAITEQ